MCCAAGRRAPPQRPVRRIDRNMPHRSVRGIPVTFPPASHSCRALIELNQLEEAQGELRTVLKNAPENLRRPPRCSVKFMQPRRARQALARYRAARSHSLATIPISKKPSRSFPDKSNWRSRPPWTTRVSLDQMQRALEAGASAACFRSRRPSGKRRRYWKRPRTGISARVGSAAGIGSAART